MGNASAPACLYSAFIQTDAAGNVSQSEPSSLKEMFSMVNPIAKKTRVIFFFPIRNLAPLSAYSERWQLVLRSTCAVNSRY